MVMAATESSARELLNRIAKDLTEVTPKPEMRSTIVRLDCYVLTRQEYEDAITRAFVLGVHEERRVPDKRHALGVK